MVANDGSGVYEIMVAFAHIAFVALLLGSALTNMFRFPWFMYADEPRPAIQRGVGIAELLVAAVVCLPYFWGVGSSVATLIAMAYGLAVGMLALWRWKKGHAFRLSSLLAPALLAFAFGVLKAGELTALAAAGQV
jgi:hypothetical protein